MALADLLWMDPSCYNSQARGGVQAHLLERLQVLTVHNIVLH